MEDTNDKSFSSVSDIDNLINTTRMQLENLKTTSFEDNAQDENNHPSFEEDEEQTINDTNKITSIEDKYSFESDAEQKIRGKPSACVFVASLCSSLSDDQLCISVTRHFKQWGNLSTVKVLRDTSNRPYAFVQYVHEKDSKIAIAEGHDSLLDGRNIRCEAAKVNRTLFIRSRYLISEYSLKKVLDEFGELENLSSSDRYGNLVTKYSKGSKYWYCKFAFRDDAIRAFANFSESKQFNAEWAQNIDEIYKKNEKNGKHKLHKFDKFSIFIGQLNNQTTEDELKKRFEIHGEIEEVVIIKKASNSFGFIKYSKESSAASAVERENHAMFNDKTMHVQYREIHPPATRTISNKYGGLALAPPPINLGKRSVSQKSIKSNESSNQSKTNSLNHNTFPLTTRKYNEATNRYNKENISSEKASKYSGSERSKSLPLRQSNITNLPEPNKFGKPYNLNNNNSNLYNNMESVPLPPPVNINYSNQNLYESNKYVPIYYNNGIPHSESSENSKGEDNLMMSYNPKIGVNDNSNNYHKSPADYYYPYQQVYFPYDPNQIQYIYGLPTVPIYFPRSISENGFPNSPPM